MDAAVLDEVLGGSAMDRAESLVANLDSLPLDRDL